MLVYVEEVGEDIGIVGVERRWSDVSEWGEFEGRYNEWGFEGWIFREFFGGRDLRFICLMVEEVNFVFFLILMCNLVFVVLVNVFLLNLVFIKYVSI